MSFNDRNFIFENYNFAVDTPWNESISNTSALIVAPPGIMTFLDNAEMEFFNGDQMTYLEA